MDPEADYDEYIPVLIADYPFLHDGRGTFSESEKHVLIVIDNPEGGGLITAPQMVLLENKKTAPKGGQPTL